MSANSKIEWTEHTFNPWWGCEKISEGCANCYACTLSKRTGNDLWGKDAPRRFFGDAHWSEPLKWDAAARKLGVMHRVFCGSMCDILEDREDLIGPRERAFRLADDTPNLLWLFLTKRPENARAFFPCRWAGNGKWPRNVMFGLTIENQPRLDERMPHVVDFQREFVGSRIFASCEPLLSALNWQPVADRRYGPGYNANSWLQYLDWVIGGGESGAKARPSHPTWFRKLRDDCVNRDDMGRPWPVPFLFKQWGEWLPIATPRMDAKIGDTLLIHPNGTAETATWSDVMESRNTVWAAQRVGKKAAGRSLDGRTWDEVPYLPYGPQLPGLENYGSTKRLTS